MKKRERVKVVDHYNYFTIGGRGEGSGQWAANAIFTETFLCSLLVATSCFHDSEFGKKLTESFGWGDKVRVTVERITSG
jgi:hypothetical protein